MQFFAVFLIFAAGIGFHQAFGWNFVQIVFAMAAMVPLAAYITDRAVRPHTRARLDNDKGLQIGFLIGVSLLAFFVFSVENTPYERVEHDIARYCAIWWHMFPYGCGVLILLDRAFNAFDPNRTAKDKEPLPPVSQRWPFDSKPRGNDVIRFDPKRFK